MIEIYKIIHTIHDKNCSLELETYQSVHATRTSFLKLANTRCHYNLRKYYFLTAELSMYGIVSHLKVLTPHPLIRSKNRLNRFLMNHRIVLTLTAEVFFS